MLVSHANSLQDIFVFRVDKYLNSSATRVVFNDDDPIMQEICLKMWQKCRNDLFNTEDLVNQTRFLVRGLKFNRRFSGDVCYGIVPVLRDSSDEITCGPLIEKPVLKNLVLNKPYALVMKRLKEEWQLDLQLQSGKFGSKWDMEFLAHQVAQMHRQLRRSSPKYGTPERVADKLEFNIQQFHKALYARRADHQAMAESAFSETDMACIEAAPELLRQLSKAHRHDFEQRHRDTHIKRCHGDLKASNLWICPPDDDSQAQEHLVALDCIDFNPEFCNIDTLSDMAMLTVDLEMRLEDATKNRSEELSGRQLISHFLQTYLKAAEENEAVWPLLECYMTEKAMVCAYMSRLYRKLPDHEERYLKVLLAHSLELAKHLSYHVGKRITKSMFPIAN